MPCDGGVDKMKCVCMCMCVHVCMFSYFASLELGPKRIQGLSFGSKHLT